MKKQTKTILIISGLLTAAVIGYMLLRRKPSQAGGNSGGAGGKTYSVINKDWDNAGGLAHRYSNGLVDYFNKDGLWKFTSNESDNYVFVNGIKYSPMSNDVPQQQSF